MSVKVQLLPSIIQKVQIPNTSLATLPADIQQLAKNYSLIHEVTVIPQKTSDSGLCKARILTPASFGSPGLVFVNQGRVPVDVPPPNLDDMRPCVFYVLGKGTLKFRTNLQTNPNHYVEATETFA